MPVIEAANDSGVGFVLGEPASIGAGLAGAGSGDGVTDGDGFADGDGSADVVGAGFEPPRHAATINAKTMQLFFMRESK